MCVGLADFLLTNAIIYVDPLSVVSSPCLLVSVAVSEFADEAPLFDVIRQINNLDDCNTSMEHLRASRERRSAMRQVTDWCKV